MERVGAGFHRVVEISAGSLSVFRGEVAGLNGDFLNGVHATLAVLLCNLPDVAGRVLSFDANAFAIGGKAVHDDRQAVLERRAGEEDDLLQGIANVAEGAAAAVGCQNGQIVDVRGSDACG